MDVAIKRAYEPCSPSDGHRILVDRVWPRGVKKSELHLDEWNKTLPPSSELRKRFGHRSENWPQFEAEYRNELQSPEKADDLRRLRSLASTQRVTLIYGARSEMLNHAAVLRDFIKDQDDVGVVIPGGASGH